ncbi:hypothetical protein [Schleiferia thermophila]|jgi:hypothetical protein|uniref:hypothetical protein n=1 Tax=Schleiferia thermophila TaxID=884107 RepID=UPI0004E64BE6|nr:hypothetical protein [Schleiferia thermophila]KFD38135.1 hypothetical protein AT05_11705 [Schleiferia thermophila str. Yellowstone]PMB22230.1 hypothetical protein CEN47_20205 [Fischerella thermalis CCMEE 5319]
MKTWLFLLLFSVALFSACKKEDQNNPLPTPSEFKDLVVSPDFKWNTTRNFTLKFIGLTTLMPEASGVLTIRTLPDGEEILRVQHKMRSSRDFQLILPAHVRTLRVQYGIVEKDIPVKGSLAEFTPIPDLDNED